MRLFVAVWPSEDVVAAIEAFDRPTLEGMRWTRSDQWHVTLRFLGSVTDDEVPALRSALGAVAASVAPREVTVGPVTGCFGRSILFVPASGLDDLAAATVTARAAMGEAPDERSFTGHFTLARSGGRSRRSRGPDLRGFAGRPLACSWLADELTLVRSRTDRTGATYEVLARWPFAG